MSDDIKTYKFSIWHLGNNKASWISYETLATSAWKALKKEAKHCTFVGLYFVCDPRSNPDGGQYGNTTFWIDEHGNIAPVVRIHRQLLGKQGLDVEVETIEI